MDKQKLTQKIVNNAPCPDGKRFEYIMDAALPGFGIQITSAGAKSYIIRICCNLLHLIKLSFGSDTRVQHQVTQCMAGRIEHIFSPFFYILIPLHPSL